MSPERRFPWWIYVLSLLLIVGFALWPNISMLIAETLAHSHGCRIEEMTIEPCVIDGRDQGLMIYNLAMTGWYMLLTLPAGLMLLIVWLLVLLLHRSARRQKGRT